jgi:hypothetical protein
MFRFACPRCGMQLSAPKECAGRSSKCRGCGQTVTVPVPVPRKRALWVITGVFGAAALALLSLVAVVPIGFAWRAPADRLLVAGQKENNPAGVDEKTNASEKLVDDDSVGLKPGKPIDEKQVVVPTKRKFNNRNVNETAEWVIARTLEINQQSSNGFRMRNESNAFDEQMKALVGKDVEWRFTVGGISEGGIGFYETWSTFDGSRYPKEPNNLFPPGGLIVVPRFRVAFYHEGRELFDPIRGPNGGDGMRGRINEPGTGLQRQMWCDGGLVIGDEIDDKQAVALEPNDVVIVNAKIRAFGVEDSLLSTGFLSLCAVCTLEAKRTDAWKRHVDEQREREAKKQSELNADKIREASEKKELEEKLAREYKQAEKDKRAKAIEHYWGAINEWREEIRRTGKEPSGEWQKKWQEKWGPIPATQQLYPPQAIKELQAEEQSAVQGISKIASDEFIKKWRAKWDYPPDEELPNPGK